MYAYKVCYELQQYIFNTFASDSNSEGVNLFLEISNLLLCKIYNVNEMGFMNTLFYVYFQNQSYKIFDKLF